MILVEVKAHARSPQGDYYATEDLADLALYLRHRDIPCTSMETVAAGITVTPALLEQLNEARNRGEMK